jgi:hypothetical protein
MDPGIIAALVGAAIGGVLAPACTFGFAIWTDRKARIRQEKLFRLQRIVQLFDDLNRLFYLARTETAYLIDALERFHQNQVRGRGLGRVLIGSEAFEAEVQRLADLENALIDRTVSSLMNAEAQAAADISQLKALLPIDAYNQLLQIFESLAQSYVYSIPNCNARLGRYKELEPKFVQLRSSQMALVNAQIIA